MHHYLKSLIIYLNVINTLRVKSQEPVQIAVPSGETFKQETLFSCPYNIVILEHLSVSHTLTV
jgi:hypothetical protein